MPNKENFPVVFEQLKTILQAFESPLVVQADTPDNYTLEAPSSLKYPKGFFLGACGKARTT